MKQKLLSVSSGAFKHSPMSREARQARGGTQDPKAIMRPTRPLPLDWNRGVCLH